MFYIIFVIVTFFFILALIYSIILIIEFFRTKFFKFSPTVTTHKTIQKEIINFLNKLDYKINLLDIGSGYGDLLFNIAKNVKNINLTGYEISKMAYYISKMRNKYLNIELIYDDIKHLETYNYNVIIAFLFKKQHRELLYLYRKFSMGTLIISNTFIIPFSEKDCFKLINTIYIPLINRNIYIYKKISD